MWVTKLLISPVKKKGFFAQKRPNLANIRLCSGKTSRGKNFKKWKTAKIVFLQ
jgi:peptide subunit release factor RF-3